jgi:predicted AAA+ superfamily ATPase
MHNGLVKIITGPRRSGKSWLLSKIFTQYLISLGVEDSQIIHISFDLDDENNQSDLLNPSALKDYLYTRITDADKQYYVMLDEVQEVEGFERIVNGLAAKENVDVYVTGSNSHYLSSDINTLFRGRGDEIRVWPFSFKEFIEGRTESISELWKEYYTFGGMPGLLLQRTAEQKITYLQRLWQKVYLTDVLERNQIRNREALETLADVLCSSIGSLTNPNKLSRTMQSVQQSKISSETVATYIDYLTDAYLFDGVKRYNIKGRKYFESIKKYYAVDVGLRNARLNFRQQEITHIMENVIYNELRIRGFLVDIGVVESRELINAKQVQSQYEVDFIATNGIDRYYIQSAYRLDTDEKKEQELKSLLKIDDSFRKMVIVGDDIAPYTDNHGITYMGLFHFLLKW